VLAPLRLRPLLLSSGAPPLRFTRTEPLRVSSWSWISDAPGFVVNSSPPAAPFSLLADCVTDCSSLRAPFLTLSDSLPSGRSGRCSRFSSTYVSPDPHTPALASRRGIGEYPPLSAPSGPGSSSPRGEAVIMMIASRPRECTGAFSDGKSHQYRWRIHMVTGSGPALNNCLAMVFGAGDLPVTSDFPL